MRHVPTLAASTQDGCPSIPSHFQLDLTSHHARGGFSQGSRFLAAVWLGPNGRPKVCWDCGLAVIHPFSEMVGSLEGSEGRWCLDGRDESSDSFPSPPSSVSPLHSSPCSHSARNLPVKPAPTTLRMRQSLMSGRLVEVGPAELEVVQVAEGGGGNFPVVFQQQATRAARV